jgi:esterase/lipase
MFSNLSDSIKETSIQYPVLDNRLPFSEYITRCSLIIEAGRHDIQQSPHRASAILEANSPYELYPSIPVYSGSKLKYGILLIHGLLDCPFSLKDIGIRLQANGMLARSVLLPGHGTKPEDLLNVSCQDWIQTVRYGIQSLKSEAEQIFLVGYSTGAALSVYHALQDPTISGIVLLAPAIKIKVPFDVIMTWHYLLKKLKPNRDWLHYHKEDDYTKYKSLPFNPVKEVSSLTTIINEFNHEHRLTCPVFMAVSREDEVISSHNAIDFFSTQNHRASELLLYSAYDHIYPDPRIFTRDAVYSDLQVQHFSHVSIPFAPDNTHYGQNGDYPYASHLINKEFIFGAYNTVEIKCYDFLHQLNLVKKKRRELTYNPDFEFMAEKIIKFIVKKS